jgi:hypothetical protein
VRHVQHPDAARHILLWNESVIRIKKAPILGKFSKTVVLVQDTFKEGAMGRAYNTHEREEECMQRFCRKARRKETTRKT